MHELGVTMEMVDMALDRANGRKVRSLRLSVGKLAAIDPRAMEFCFEACSKATLLEGAALVLEIAPAIARCRDCREETEIRGQYGHEQCRCGSSALEVVSGHDVILVDVEVM